MADQSATFAINLEDGTSGAAVSAATALDQLRSSLTADTRELAAMQKAMKNLQGGSSVNIAQFRQLKAAIDAKKQAISQSQGAIIGLGGSLSRTASGGRQTVSLFESITKSAQGAGGPLGGVVGRLASLKGLLAGGAIALGVVAIAAALAALVVAATAAAGALLTYGVAQANARRSELLRLEGLTKMRNWWGIAAGNASEMQAAIDKVSMSTALGRDKLQQYTEQLYRSGLRGQNLTDALEGTAIKAAVLGDAAAGAFAGWAAAVAHTGGSVRALADDVKARFGGIAAAQMLDLNVQTAKLRENFAALFSGLRIDGLLKGLHEVTSLFSQATATGRALQAMLSALFNPVLDGIAGAAPIVKRFFQGMVIGALHATIALLTVRNWLKRTFADSEILGWLNTQKMALYAGGAAFAALAGFAGVAFVAIAGFAALLAVTAIPALLACATALGALVVVAAIIAAPFALAASAVALLVGTLRGLFRVLSSVDWSESGVAIVKGIAAGMWREMGALRDTVKGLASDTLKTFKSALGIASPSRLFATAGLAIPQGVELGIDRGAPDAQRAAQSLVEAPRVSIPAPAPAPQGGRAQQAGGGGTVTVGEIHVHTAATKAADIVQDIRRELERCLEGVAIQMGAPVAGGGA